MELASDNPKVSSADADKLLAALFVPDDLILVRPIESWTEEGKKRTRVDYEGVRCQRLGALNLPEMMTRAAEERTNIFFGVCPRFGNGGQFDLAWQIRTVRCLWSNVDDCRPERALQRWKDAKLPPPSIVVNSGNGCHLYWLLDQPYLIDDVGDPPPVFTEFFDQGPKKKRKVRKYLKGPQTGEKLYLDAKQNVPPLSPKAQHVQDILAGIGAKIGGDHTQDLSRLLRVPGTLNRKDQRNGREPVLCCLVECEPERRYPITEFEHLVNNSPDKRRREQVAKVKPPAARKPSATKLDRLSELVLLIFAWPMIRRGGPSPGKPGFRWKPSAH